MACLNCFKNYGVQRIARSLIVSEHVSVCELCSSKAHVFRKEDLGQILGTIFISGSIPPLCHPGAPIYQASESSPKRDIEFLTELDNDLAILEDELNVGLFHYGPPTWRVGITEYSLQLDNECSKTQNSDDLLAKVISRCAEKIIDTNFDIFRVRAESKLPPATPRELDTPPKTKTGRYNASDIPIFYAATDPETCLHETRVTIADHILLGLFRPKRQLNLLDLTQIQESVAHPSESVALFFETLFYSDESGYHLSQRLSAAIKKQGYDGFITKSYFNQAHENDLTNISIFGYPIKENKLKLVSTNRLKLDRIKYDYTYGPVNDNTLPIDLDNINRFFKQQDLVIFDKNMSQEEKQRESRRLHKRMFPKSDTPI